MSTYQVAVAETSTAIVEVEADDADEAIELVNELIDNGEVEFEPNGSYEYDVEEL